MASTDDKKFTVVTWRSLCEIDSFTLNCGQLTCASLALLVLQQIVYNILNLNSLVNFNALIKQVMYKRYISFRMHGLIFVI